MARADAVDKTGVYEFINRSGNFKSLALAHYESSLYVTWVDKEKLLHAALRGDDGVWRAVKLDRVMIEANANFYMNSEKDGLFIYWYDEKDFYTMKIVK